MMLLLPALALLPVAVAAAPTASTSVAIEAPGPSGPLKGTLLTPGKGAPVVLILPGSGPIDRDGNGRSGSGSATYRLLAEGLADRGIATVRVDKRGMFGSAAAVADANRYSAEDYAADLHSWATSVRRVTGVRCVWALGHSEGGLVALLAARHPDGICGLILVAAPGRRLGDILRAQFRANPQNAPILPQAMSAIDALEAGRHIDTTGMNTALLPIFRTAVQDSLISELRWDPAALIKQYRGPVLIVQGDRDLQITTADSSRLAAADPAAKVVIVSHANHVLKLVGSDDPAANFATYTDPHLPVAPQIVAAIASFVGTGVVAREPVGMGEAR